MPSYRCSLEIDVTAESAVEAAHIAQEEVRHALSTGERYVWEVEEFEGPNLGTTMVDTEAE